MIDGELSSLLEVLPMPDYPVQFHSILLSAILGV